MVQIPYSYWTNKNYNQNLIKLYIETKVLNIGIDRNV